MFQGILSGRRKDDGWGWWVDTERLAMHIHQSNPGKVKPNPFRKSNWWTGLAPRERSSSGGQGVQVAPGALAPGRVRVASDAFCPPLIRFIPLILLVLLSHYSCPWHTSLSLPVLLSTCAVLLPSLPTCNWCSACMPRKVTRFCSLRGARRGRQASLSLSQGSHHLWPMHFTNTLELEHQLMP